MRAAVTARGTRASARWASDPARSRGRRFTEPAPHERTEFQRDRDRIVHSTAFRRLEYKTQVFVNHEGDLFRTRLTHTLEVAQIARSIARALGADEDLTEAIALAHDLGHTPFGHAGQDALHECMRVHGGFEHNLQSLRVVDVLEERYGAFDGLNLTFEAREGIVKRCARRDAARLGDLGQRFIDRTQPSIEAQIAHLADEIAYDNHDVDDGLRAGLITPTALREVALYAAHEREALHVFPGLAGRRLVHETVRRMIDALVTDVIAQTRERLALHRPRTSDDVRGLPPLVAFSESMRARSVRLKRFLMQRLYRHPHVVATTAHARRVVRDLFEAYTDDPRRLPPSHREAIDRRGGLHRCVCDYVAGMTDRFAIAEHRRLVGVSSVAERTF